MIPVPWRYVKSWGCLACGRCCKGFDVVLGFNEWVNIVRAYGVGTTKPSINKIHIRKKSDGTCVFLYKFFDRWLCGLQDMKPRACKLWPFKIYKNPKYGRPHEALFTRWKKNFFIYVDPLCTGIRWGTPTWEFMHKTLPEFLEIGLGVHKKQHYSTSKIPYHPIYLRLRKKGSFEGSVFE